MSGPGAPGLRQTQSARAPSGGVRRYVVFVPTIQEDRSCKLQAVHLHTCWLRRSSPCGCRVSAFRCSLDSHAILNCLLNWWRLGRQGNPVYMNIRDNRGGSPRWASRSWACPRAPSPIAGLTPSGGCGGSAFDHACCQWAVLIRALPARPSVRNVLAAVPFDGMVRSTQGPNGALRSCRGADRAAMAFCIAPCPIAASTRATHSPEAFWRSRSKDEGGSALFRTCRPTSCLRRRASFPSPGLGVHLLAGHVICAEVTAAMPYLRMVACG